MSIEILRPDAISTLPQAVLFDTDNTIYHYDPPHAEATRIVEAKATHMLNVSVEDFRAAFDTARSDVKARLGHTASSHSRLLYFQQTLELLGLKSQLLMALDFEQTYWRTFLAKTEVFPDVRDLLLDLRGTGIATATITDLTSQIQFRKMIYFELDGLFDFVVTSEEAGFDKPHHQAFDLAIDKLGIAPEHIWMIGDDPHCDIEGAKAFGMTTFQKRHAGVKVLTADARADVVFDDFAELRALLAKLSGK